MKRIYSLLLILLVLLSVASCKKELAEANINPNRPEIVDPEYLLNTSILKTINLFGGKMRQEVFSHYSNYVSVGGGQFPRYFTFPSSNNNYWQTAYISCLQPVNRISVEFGQDPKFKNRVAIAKIFESYIYSNIVAIWGGVPRDAALSGEVHIPYESEEAIYMGLLATLKDAADAIDPDGDKYPAKADAVFAGDLLKWKKFANTLRLRIALQMSNGNPGESHNVISEVLANEENTISSPSETALAKWGTTSDTWSYLYEYNVVSGVANASSLNVISESLIQHMLPYGDPRLAVYARPAAQGPQKGKYYGQPKSASLPSNVSMNPNPHSSLSPADYSMIGDRFLKADEEYVFLSFEETQFLKAEIALKGWGGSKSAEEYYKSGITASMQKYGIPQAAINTYLETPGIKWNTTVDTTGRKAEFSDYIGITTSAITRPDPFRQIVMQSWIAGFYNALDAWTLQRRTQVLEFPPHFNPDGGEGGNVGYAYIPQRLTYPDIEYQVNKDQVQGAVARLGGPDAMKTKLWFALPVTPNPFLPQ